MSNAHTSLRNPWDPKIQENGRWERSLSLGVSPFTACSWRAWELTEKSLSSSAKCQKKCPVLWASSYHCSTYTSQLALGHGCSSWQGSQIRVSMQAQAWSWNSAETNRKGGRTAKAQRSVLLPLYSNIVQTQKANRSKLNFVYNGGSK